MANPLNDRVKEPKVKIADLNARQRKIYDHEGYLKRKADPDDRARVERARERMADPEVKAKKVISNRNGKKAWNARLDANPVEKERVRKATLERRRERRARIKADPVAWKKLRDREESARRIRRMQAKRARLEEILANEIE